MKILHFIYGAVCYILFFGTFLYAIGFVANCLVPKSIDSGAETSQNTALLINIILLGVFGLQHSIMARVAFKEKWTKIVPQAIERSTYVLFTVFALTLLFWQWRPLPDVIWDVRGGALEMPLWILCGIGWVTVLVSTFLINHFELFGLHQVYQNLKETEPAATAFRTPLLYKFVRHPIYFGFSLAFWATPMMTMGHLLFAVVTVVYTLVAIQLEERDLIAIFGDTYRDYKKRVSMLIPLPPRR